MTQAHWEDVYRSKEPEAVSWYQPEPSASLHFIEQARLAPGDAIIDIGGGASTLVDGLLKRGFTDLTILDISRAAIDANRERLGGRAGSVNWIVGDVLKFQADRTYALWHDRACFHFMTRPEQRRLYFDALERAVEPGGGAIIATFAPDGPRRCSGLEIVRYDAPALLEELGPGWRLEDQHNEQHKTPWNSVQSFQYFLLRRA